MNNIVHTYIPEAYLEWDGITEAPRSLCIELYTPEERLVLHGKHTSYAAKPAGIKFN